MNIHHSRVIAGLSVIGIILSCGGGGATDEFVRREVTELQKRTIPPGSRVLIQSGPLLDGWSKSAHWEFETSWNWAYYEEWAGSQLRHEFVLRRVGGDHLLLIRSLHGDSEELRIRAIVHEPKLRVMVEFLIYPD